jgi:hypothetical protein
VPSLDTRWVPKLRFTHLVRAHIVAIGDIAGRLDDEAPAIAAAAGLTVFDVKTRLGGPLPRVLFQSPTEEPARRVLAAVRAAGHGAFLCDTEAVPRAGDLVRVRRFAFDETGLFSDGLTGVHLPFDRIGAIVRLAMRSNVVRSTKEKELRPQGGRPARTVEVEHENHETLVVHAAYLVPRPAGATRPRSWLLHEREASFLALGAALRQTRRDNLTAALDLIRERAPGAIYDDRFVAHPLLASHVVTVRDNLSPDPPGVDAAVALSAFLLAEWLLGGAPYR